MRKSEPLLDGVIEKTQPLERTLKLRELQTSYVYTTVLAKKCRVSALLCTPLYCRKTMHLHKACMLSSGVSSYLALAHARIYDWLASCTCAPCEAF